MIRLLLWLAWLAALAAGSWLAVTQGMHGPPAWYVPWATGSAIGLATWFRRPPLRRDR